MKHTRNRRNKQSKSYPSKISKNKTLKMKRKQGRLHFSDFPEFRPNITPREMFELGSFGGTYWRQIDSTVTKKSYKSVHKKYPFLGGIPESDMSCMEYDIKKNKYGVKVGTSLEFWEGKNWITKYHPYGWVQWYCDFCMGRRCPDDERQISRWLGLAGSRGRFQRFLVTQILKKEGKWNDHTISPKIRQVLQHWAYHLTKTDFDKEILRRKNNS
jgi:hypothetical protein